MGQFNDKRICGAPFPHNFRTVKRPNLKGECPDGYLACNAESQPDNIYCVEEYERSGKNRTLEQRCPIVNLEFVKKADLDSWYATHGAVRPLLRDLQSSQPSTSEPGTEEANADSTSQTIEEPKSNQTTKADEQPQVEEAQTTEPTTPDEP